MLQSFRDNLKGTAFFIVVLISVPFALVGIDQIFLGSSATKAELSVNGEDITQLEVERALRAKTKGRRKTKSRRWMCTVCCPKYREQKSENREQLFPQAKRSSRP